MLLITLGSQGLFQAVHTLTIKRILANSTYGPLRNMADYIIYTISENK